MKRLSCALVLAGLLGSSPAWADPKIERAKKAFAEGKRLHDAGKLTEAIEKFKASYELSKNPLLLYNIALTMEELGADNLDLAVVFYRRFLAEAPSDAPQRPDVTARVAAITSKLAPAPAPEPPPPPPAPEPRSFGPADFQHQAVEAAPPNSPLDITASAPPEANFTVVVFFRGTDEPGFASTAMQRHGDELVARIPAARLTGRTIQYYVEVRDAAGAVVTRAGKPSSPNVVVIDASAPARFSPDVTEGPITPAPPVALGNAGNDKEDPMARAPAPVEPERGNGLAIARWTTTGVAVAGLGLGITFYALAANHGNALANDATSCGTPPCRGYDDYDRDLQRTGQRYQTAANVALFGGLAVAAAAGYLWYRELAGHHAEAHAEAHAARRTPPRWAVAPSFGTYTGAAAAVRF